MPTRKPCALAEADWPPCSSLPDQRGHRFVCPVPRLWHRSLVPSPPPRAGLRKPRFVTELGSGASGSTIATSSVASLSLARATRRSEVGRNPKALANATAGPVSEPTQKKSRLRPSANACLAASRTRLQATGSPVPEGQPTDRRSRRSQDPGHGIQTDHCNRLPVALSDQPPRSAHTLPPRLLVVLQLLVIIGNEAVRGLKQRLQPQVATNRPIAWIQHPHTAVAHAASWHKTRALLDATNARGDACEGPRCCTAPAYPQRLG